MFQSKSKPIPSSEITPQPVYINRRQFLKAAELLGAGALLAACAPGELTTPAPDASPLASGSDELGDPLTAFQDATNYNNYYEFTTDKTQVANLAADFQSSPWTVEVSGLVNRPKTYDIQDLLAHFTQEERIYRLRCVEAWSMVLPWTGFQLSDLLNEVEPMGDAQYVRFETLNDPQQFPGQKNPLFPWPYQEGLRLDEAMHPLTILATGMYGQALPAQDGAPIRLVVPWKYGFKSIKSIVKIELVRDMPATFWSGIAPDEYGFYANVNPNVSHPRWSQATERRIGENGRRDTLLFNGYEEDVAGLYAGMDLQANY